jgi:hypothetical protein
MRIKSFHLYFEETITICHDNNLIPSSARALFAYHIDEVQHIGLVFLRLRDRHEQVAPQAVLAAGRAIT